MTAKIKQSSNIVKICSKYDIHLTKNKENDIFTIQFTSDNLTFSIEKILNLSIYNLMGELNPDIFDRIEIINKNNDKEADILFCFKQFGQELGISKKYMCINTKINKENNRFTFFSNSIPYKNEEVEKQYEVVTSEFSDLYIDLLDDHKVNINYVFKMDLHEELPIYMENLIGMMMKKVFYRLKVFIEKMEI